MIKWSVVGSLLCYSSKVFVALPIPDQDFQARMFATKASH
jgi:hypothetical protein